MLFFGLLLSLGRLCISLSCLFGFWKKVIKLFGGLKFLNCSREIPASKWECGVHARTEVFTVRVVLRSANDPIVDKHCYGKVVRPDSALFSR